jgi:Uma2 family endonuclease
LIRAKARTNLAAALLAHLRGTPCKVMGPEMKLRVDAETPGFYPDLFVACREIDVNASELNEAKVIVEVLSPSTEKKDRGSGSKWIEHQKLAMLQEYLLIDPVKRRVEIFRRMGAADWRLHICSAAELVRLESLDFDISFAAVFEDLG